MRLRCWRKASVAAAGWEATRPVWPSAAAVAIGGNGGLGGNGGPVTLNLAEGVFASTSTLGGAGILAQSIGGSGGAGGSATLKGVGLLLLAIGGDAGRRRRWRHGECQQLGD